MHYHTEAYQQDVCVEWEPKEPPLETLLSRPISEPTIKTEGLKNWVYSVAFSPDGKFALSGGTDKTVGLWDVATGKEIRSFVGHTNYVSSVAFSPDGRFALSGSKDETVRLWDVATGKQIRAFTGHTHGVSSVVFSPDGRFALSGGRSWFLRLWDVATGKQIRSFVGHKDSVGSVAFSPDGKFALSGSEDKTVRLWDVATGKEIRSFVGHTTTVNSVAFSPDGRFALSAGDDTPRIWDINTGREIARLIGLPDAQQSEKRELPKRIESSLQSPVRETPSKMGFIAKLNAEITAINFFEGPKETRPPQKERVYSRVFPKTQSRAIYVEVNLAHPAPGYRIDFQMEFVFYRPNGTVLGQHKFNSYILSNWLKSRHIGGYGWSSYGTDTWETGKYRVAVYLDGNKIAEESFTVY